jgi:hypothetical protein
VKVKEREERWSLKSDASTVKWLRPLGDVSMGPNGVGGVYFVCVGQIVGMSIAIGAWTN